MPRTDWSALAAELQSMLSPAAPPIAITFSDTPVENVPAFDEPMAAPAPDGRTGRVPAGCVFWMKSTDKTFSTVAEDHGNCSVGSVTHGFKTLGEVVGNSDVAALLESGWVSEERRPLDSRHHPQARLGRLRPARRDADGPGRGLAPARAQVDDGPLGRAA